MKILFIAPRFPYPALKGDQTVVYNRLKVLGKKHEISLLTFFETDAELEGLSKLGPLCQEVHFVKLSKCQALSNIAFRGVFSGLPLQVLYYQSQDFREKLHNLLEQNHYDLIHAFLIRMAPYVSEIKLPIVLELIDSMQLNLQRRIQMETIPTKWIFCEELRRMVRYERQAHLLADRLIVVADKDKEFLHSASTHVIPNGVDMDLFLPARNFSNPEPSVIFSGNMGYAPNVHAVRWFIQNCWDYVKRAVPMAKLVIAGGGVSGEIQRLDGVNGIVVTGYVSSMADTLQSATVAIAPMQSGSGIQNKILEAMSCALPVVTTRLGYGSIKAKPEEAILVCDSPSDFSRQVINLLNDPLKAQTIGEAARLYVEKYHSWEYGASLVEQIYCELYNER